MAIDVVATDVQYMFCIAQPSSFAVITVRFAFLAVLRIFVREMEIDGEVQSVVIRQFIAVSFAEILHVVSVPAPSGFFAVIDLCGERTSVAGGVHPCAGYVDTGCNLVLQCDTQIVFAVVFGVEGFAVIDVVKLAHRAAPCVAYPSCHGSYLALCEELDAIAPAVANRHFALPVGGITHIACAVFVFQQVQTPFVISLYRQFHLSQHVITDTGCHLHRTHRRHLLRHRHPHIARQRQ